ncbi:hypothetical protein [Magnetospirillum sp. 15-1]|uniref:hypothetical protein n=1 Tax=Magnetospirillum sp. 15-1 TaxID=1979370 RepID=UPI000BBCF118|nr:hypothetical protein [Magnetospirillum sp. 15-1]
MRLSRRAVLGAALGGGTLAALRGLPAAAMTAPVSGATLVLADPSVSPAFAEAVRNWTGGSVRTVAGPQTLADAARWLAAAPGRRVVGLVDDADGVLFQQMVPRGRATWLSAIHHAPRSTAGADWEIALGDGLGRMAAGRGTGGSPDAGGPLVARMSFVVAG